MVQVQILSKVLNTKDYSIIKDNLLDESFFRGYEKEFTYINNYYNKYGQVPDKATFIEKFLDFNIENVQDTDESLIDRIKEEHLFYETIPTLEKVSKLLENGSTNQAIELLSTELRKLDVNYNISSTDIIKEAERRYEYFEDRINNQTAWYFSSGFTELDNIIHGIQRGEELFVIFARINQGKSWILEKMCVSVWEQGFNVGFVSPEMSATSIGYRFDTLHKNFSNKALMWGTELSDTSSYKSYLKKLAKKDNKLLVSTPIDFGRKITVSKLRNFVIQNKLDLLAIDGITYLTDERQSSKDNKTTKLTNISEDLMSLSNELKIPILVVVQANRNGVATEDNDGTPELETIRDSDGIAQNASKVISIRQKNGVLELGIKKQRSGVVGGTILYSWNIDTGEFTWIPSEEDAVDEEIKAKQIEENKALYANDITAVF